MVVSPAALAGEKPLAPVKAAGEVWFDQGGTTAFAAPETQAVGPAAAGEKDQPAQGILMYRDASGHTYQVAVQHIHAHGVTLFVDQGSAQAFTDLEPARCRPETDDYSGAYSEGVGAGARLSPRVTKPISSAASSMRRMGS